MNSLIRITALGAAFLLTAISSFSQNLQTDIIQKQDVMEGVVTNYYKAIGEQSRLYNGPEYNFYDPIIKGNAYYYDAVNFTPGTVEYDGFVYKNVPLMYDIYKDFVVVLLPNKSAKFRLLSDRVQSFDLLDHHFVYVNTDGEKDKQVNSGFFDQLYKGKVEVLIKRSKSIQSSSGVSAVETYFTSKKQMYIKNKGRYYSVGGEGSLLNALKDKKKELKQYIRTNNIKFGDDEEQAMVKVATYYDQITL